MKNSQKYVENLKERRQKLSKKLMPGVCDNTVILPDHSSANINCHSAAEFSVKVRTKQFKIAFFKKRQEIIVRELEIKKMLKNTDIWQISTSYLKLFFFMEI